MNILALVREQQDLAGILDYAKRISNEGDKVHLLNIIAVPGNIPSLSTGEMLDDCSEFDVSLYLKEQKTNENWLKNSDLGNYIAAAQVVVGNRYAILKNQVKTHNIDVVLTATKHTSRIEDFFKNTSAGIAHDKLAVPVLAFKCDRSHEEIKDIAIVSDFEHTEKENLDILKQIAAKSNATITLFGFAMDESHEILLKKKMQRFVTLHELPNMKQIIIHSTHKEKSAKELLFQYPMQLMVLLDLHRKGLNKILKGDLEKDLLNHQLIPILAY